MEDGRFYNKKMKVSLFTKTGKPTVNKVIDYLNDNFVKVSIYQGKRGDLLPVECLDEVSDIAVSYLSPWIIPGQILNRTRLWNINFHPGSPKYPGIGCFNFAIYNQEETYGVTAHIMEEKVDCGRIIGTKYFPLSDEYSVSTLSIKSYENMLSLFLEIMDYIYQHKELPRSKEQWQRPPYTRKELENLCLINKDMTEEEVKRRVRATTYPDMPAAYLKMFGFKFEYNTQR